MLFLNPSCSNSRRHASRTKSVFVAYRSSSTHISTAASRLFGTGIAHIVDSCFFFFKLIPAKILRKVYVEHLRKQVAFFMSIFLGVF